MPTVSVFYGVYIRMYVKDHPPPHFHAAYAEWEACFSIETGEITEGRLPGRAAKLVREWAELHRQELTLNWRRGQNEELLEKIEGLDAH
jgi:hypothetical protein